MDMTWDLSVLYSGYDDPKYKSDSDKLLVLIDKVKKETLDTDDIVKSIENHLFLEKNEYKRKIFREWKSAE